MATAPAPNQHTIRQGEVPTAERRPWSSAKQHRYNKQTNDRQQTDIPTSKQQCLGQSGDAAQLRAAAPPPLLIQSKA